MTSTLDQASAILKAAEEIVALEKRIGLKLDMAEYIEPDDYDGEEIDEANTLALAYAGRIALALIEKHRALEEALELFRSICSAYENQDLNHVDFRVKCAEFAHAFLARQGATA